MENKHWVKGGRKLGGVRVGNLLAHDYTQDKEGAQYKVPGLSSRSCG